MTVTNFPLVNEFPYGLNIHFAMDLLDSRIIFLHDSLSWIVGDYQSTAEIALLESTVKPDFIPVIIESFKQFKEGKFTGSIQICLNSERWIRITPYLSNTAESDILLATLEEITHAIGYESMLIKYTNKKNSILYMLGHDLRGPLGAAKALVNTMDRTEDPNRHVKIAHITRIIEQSIGLIDDLTQRELLDSMKVELVKKQFNIVKILSDYMDECKKSDQLSERFFGFSSTSEEIYVGLDNSKFMQVINNVISNSLKFTRPGGHIDLHVSETPTTVEMQVIDDGIGIPEHLIPVLFDKYTAAARPGLNGEPTIGLGMSIVKLILDWHNGAIRCESEEGKGTTFFISLPKEGLS